MCMLQMFISSCASPYDAYLTNYWPISNGHLNDLVGHADMMQVAYTSFATDRLGNPKSALDLYGSWLKRHLLSTLVHHILQSAHGFTRKASLAGRAYSILAMMQE